MVCYIPAGAKLLFERSLLPYPEINANLCSDYSNLLVQRKNHIKLSPLMFAAKASVKQQKL